jgi:putative hydrolase of the HAD superfamily
MRAAEVGRLLGEDWKDMASFVRRARGADPDAVIRPEALAAIAAAKRDGHQVAILSNELDLFYGADFRSRLSFLPMIDLLLDLSDSTVLKPDPRAYARLATALGQPAQDCVFVDDQIRNVTGARRAGMRAVAFDVRQPARSFTEALALLRVQAAPDKEIRHA